MSKPLYSRRIQSCPALAQPVPVPSLADDAGVRDWLTAQASAHRLRWLLAHLDDGVLWGRWDTAAGLVTGHDAAAGDAEALACCPALRLATLQQARLFAPHAELLLWRADDGAWCARLLRDRADGAAVAADADAWDDAFDEPQLLWGDTASPLADDFTLLAQGRRGLRHVVPYIVTQNHKTGKIDPQTLLVRHYLTRGGPAQVAISRLVTLSAAEAKP